MGSSTSFEQFDEVKKFWEPELIRRSDEFDIEVYQLAKGKIPIMSKESKPLVLDNQNQDKLVQNNKISQQEGENSKQIDAKPQIPKVEKPEEGNEKSNKPELTPLLEKKGDGKTVPTKVATENSDDKNLLIVLHSERVLNIHLEEKIDFEPLNNAISKITNSVAGVLGEGIKSVESVASGSPLAILSTLTEAPKQVADAISNVVKGITLIFSSTKNVGLSEQKQVYYVEPGIYVAQFSFMCSITVEKWNGKSVADCWMTKYLICTSTELLKRSLTRSLILKKMPIVRESELLFIKSMAHLDGYQKCFSYIKLAKYARTKEGFSKIYKKANKNIPPKPTPKEVKDFDQDAETRDNWSGAIDFANKLGQYEGYDTALSVLVLVKGFINTFKQDDFDSSNVIDYTAYFKGLLEDFSVQEARTIFKDSADTMAKAVKDLMDMLDKLN